MTPARRDVLAFARLGFCGLDGQGVSLHRRMVIPDLGLLHECLATCGLPPRMLDDLWPHVSTVELGREGSEVLYVVVPYWTHQANGHRPAQPHERIAPEQRRALAQRLRDLGVAYRASEISVTTGVSLPEQICDFRGVPDDPYQVRIGGTDGFHGWFLHWLLSARKPMVR